MDIASCRATDFPIEPGSLSVSPGGDWFASLYTRYAQELMALCSRLQRQRQTMVAAGFSADFSDREGELAYLLVRALQPNVVVEISPRHGFSTNYLLAGLTQNGHGRLLSYEIETHIHGTPIEQAIRGNLLPDLDQKCLEITIGDAMTATIPSADLLFIDSCHEAYFASWYLSKLVPQARIVMTHDILIHDPVFASLVPKAAMLGIHEQYFLLEALAIAGQKCFAAAQLNSLISSDILPNLPARNPVAPERAIVFQGHALTDQAQVFHTEYAAIQALRKSGEMGDSIGVFRRIREMLSSPVPVFIKLEALRLIPGMGYKQPLHKNEFPAWEPTREEFSVSNIVQYAEYLAASFNFAELSRLFGEKRLFKIQPEVLAYFDDHFGKVMGRSRFTPRALFHRARHLLKKHFRPSKTT